MATSAATILRQRRIVDYLDATKNEIAIDESLLRISGLRPEGAGYIPRVPKWISSAKRHPAVVRNVARVAWLIWVLGGSVAFLLLEFVPRWLSALCARRDVTPLSPSGYVLALSSRVGDVMDASTFPDLPNVWITVPWARLQRKPVGAQVIDVFSLLSAKDLVDALCDAFIAQRRFLRRAATRKWVLQGYTAFRWFAVRKAVDKLAGGLVMADHFDRWAVLADRAARRPRRSLTLIQHGAVSGLEAENEGGRALFDFPTKLQCVSSLHVYGREDEAIFKRHILAEGRRNGGPEVRYFEPHIQLRSSAVDASMRVLFVGHPMCEPIQAALFRSLRNQLTFDAYYKPHPLAPMSAAMGAVGWQVITEPDHFPEVDLLISYPSTLVVEYAALDIPAVVHPLNSGVEQCDMLAQKVLAHIKPLAVQ